MCNIVQGKTLSMFSQPETLGIYKKDYSLQKKTETVCLGRGDSASADQMFVKKLVDWRGALLEAGECYLCIWYMLVGFQLITKKKPKRWVPAQQGSLAWRGEMLSGSIRKHLPQV